jgi:hypothetical protein
MVVPYVLKHLHASIYLVAPKCFALLSTCKITNYIPYLLTYDTHPLNYLGTWVVSGESKRVYKIDYQGGTFGNLWYLAVDEPQLTGFQWMVH